MSRWNWKCLVGLLAAATLLGCDSGPDNPDTVAVSGTITYQGKPVEDAVVTFAPMDKETGKAAMGKTDAEGKYTLTTFVSGDGAIAGQYQVGIMKVGASAVAADTGSQPVGSEKDPGAAYEAAEEAGADIFAEGGGAAAAEKEAKDELPVKYKNPESSGLMATVSEQNKVHDFELTD